MAITKTKSIKTVASEAVAPVMPGKPRRKRPLVRMIGFFIGGIVVAGIFFLAVVVTGSYMASWQMPWVKQVAAAVPYPAVIVNGSWNSYHDFMDTVSALDQSYSQPGALEASGLTEKPSQADLEVLVLDRMAKDTIVEQLAAERGVEITQTALDTAMRDIIDQTGSETEVRNRISQLYGWDLATFADRVVRPFLFRQRLQEKIAFDDTINADQKRRAEELLARVKAADSDFGAIAEEVNEDATKSLKGDYGIFARGERDPAIEEVAFTLEPGQTSEIIRTAQGFHIIKLVEKLAADEATGDAERVHLTHIFLAAEQLDSWLFEQAKTQKVRVLLGAYRWDQASTRVITTDKTVVNVNATQ